MGGMITEEDLKRWEMQQQQQQQLDEWEEQLRSPEVKLALERWLTNQHPLTNPPSSSRIPESGEKLSLQIRIIGEQSSGVRLLKKEYLIELPCREVNLDAEAWIGGVQIANDLWKDALIIPLKSQPQSSDSPEVITPPQHGSKVIG